MKEQITIYYDKDKKHPNDYIIKRVLTPDGNKYTIISYYKIFGMVKRFHSKIELSNVAVNKSSSSIIFNLNLALFINL